MESKHLYFRDGRSEDSVASYGKRDTQGRWIAKGVLVHRERCPEAAAQPPHGNRNPSRTFAPSEGEHPCVPSLFHFSLSLPAASALPPGRSRSAPSSMP